jgi:N-acetylglucosamine kinase-like BadF-type ATPase
MLKLIADCGSTKIDWAVVDTCVKPYDEPCIKQFKSTGFNAAVTAPEEIRRILDKKVRPQIEGLKIEAVHFYGAGCIGGDVNEHLSAMLAELMPAANIEVASDLLGAARALFGREPGITCILGTGANSGLYDGNEIIEHIPPLGYIIGDEGSGAYLGKQFIRMILRYPGMFKEETVKDFNEKFGLTQADIIDRVYRQPNANRFLASFAPFIKKHIKDKLVADIVKDAFVNFLIEQAAYYGGVPLPASIPPSEAPAALQSSAEALTTSLSDALSTPLTLTSIDRPTAASPAPDDDRIYDSVLYIDHSDEFEGNDAPIGFIGSIAANFSKILEEACNAYCFNDPIILKSPLPSLINYHASR